MQIKAIERTEYTLEEIMSALEESNRIDKDDNVDPEDYGYTLTTYPGETINGIRTMKVVYVKVGE